MKTFEQLFEAPVQIEMAERQKAQDLKGGPEADGAPPTFRCRVCKLEGPERAFCPVCLADTMVPVPRK